MPSASMSYPENLKSVRDDQFARLKDSLFFDHAGSTLFAASQVQSFAKDLQENLYGNPHSGNPSSDMTRAIIHQVRARVLAFFNVTLDDYDVVFCSGCTDALKMVGQYLDWKKESSFVYLEDNHTSVVGIRELAAAKGAACYCLSLPRCVNLFAYPAQSNFSGCRYPLHWISKVQTKGVPQLEGCDTSPSKPWLVLLDAAGFVSTAKLDLKANPVDFACISFYKIFGFPTGIGALLVKNDSAKHLTQKRYFGGGTANGYLAQSDFYNPRQILHERLEDGSLNFLDIIALKYGFDALNRICGSAASISQHTFALAQRMYSSFQELRHANGEPVLRVYSHTEFDSCVTQGPIVTFNVTREDGSFVGFNHVVHLASSRNIHLRAGCFCNVGACSAHLRIEPQRLKHVYESGHVCGDGVDLVDGYPVGAVRASIGYMSTQDDVDKLVSFLRECFVQTPNVDVFYDAVSDVEPPKTEKVVLEKITLYPVKSCQGMDVDEWEVCDTGLKYDRNWMIVNEYGVCLTLKRHTKLTMIYPRVDLERSVLVLSAKGFGCIEVPLDCAPGDSDHVTADFCHTRVCGDRIVGLDCGAEASDWLSDVIGETASLVRKLPGSQRPSKRKSPSVNGSPVANGHHLALTNEAQYLLLSRASLDHVINAMARDGRDEMAGVDGMAARFRPNFLLSGAPPFDEESWKSITFTSTGGEFSFECVGLCNRCSMVCIDQRTGQRSVEPLRTLGTLPPSKYVKDEVQKIPSRRRNHFGVYLRSAARNFRVKVGTRVTKEA